MLDGPPPYIAYRTFRNFLEFLGGNMPARIDRSVWGERFSGSNGAQIMATLRAFELIDADNKPKPELERLSRATGNERRQLLTRILQRAYKPLFEIDLARASRAQFKEAFKKFGVAEKLQIKCESFFVSAARDADIALSKFILKGRHGARAIAPTPRAPAPAAGDAKKTDAKLEIINLILKKYPDFDASWDAEVQKQWFAGMRELYDSIT